jgi:hypothetical protein
MEGIVSPRQNVTTKEMSHVFTGPQAFGKGNIRLRQEALWHRLSSGGAVRIGA